MKNNFWSLKLFRRFVTIICSLYFIYTAHTNRQSNYFSKPLAKATRANKTKITFNPRKIRTSGDTISNIFLPENETKTKSPRKLVVYSVNFAQFVLRIYTHTQYTTTAALHVSGIQPSFERWKLYTGAYKRQLSFLEGYSLEFYKYVGARNRRCSC